jgi:adenylosuccinate lyase
MDTDFVPNVLADRYASAAMKSIWSTRGRVVLEREYWIAVMKAQKELGLEIPRAQGSHESGFNGIGRTTSSLPLPSINPR